MKTNLDYFTHYSNASEHPKFLALRARYDFAGEGRFWALNGMIAASENCKYDLTRKFARPSAAQKLGLTLEDFEAFLVYLRDDCELIHYENDIIWTEQTQDDLTRVIPERKRQQERRNGVRVPTANEDEKNAYELKKYADADDRAEQSRAKQSKAEQSKANAPELDAFGDPLDDPPAMPAAAGNFIMPEDLKTELASCPHAVRISATDANQIVQRLNDLALPLAFVGYCIKRSGDAKATNPGGFIRSALLGQKVFDDYPEQFLEEQQKRKPKPVNSGTPPPTICTECGSTLDHRADEAICRNCNAFWEYSTKTRKWVLSSEKVVSLAQAIHA